MNQICSISTMKAALIFTSLKSAHIKPSSTFWSINHANHANLQQLIQLLRIEEEKNMARVGHPILIIQRLIQPLKSDF